MSLNDSGTLPTRRFGRHEDRVTIIGLGGGHISRPEVSAKDAVRIIGMALDEGINFIDTAWDYAYGESERRMGKALQGCRDDVFLMTKVCARESGDASRQIDESLERLGVDYVDLLQLHEINYDNDPEWCLSSGGALEAAVQARDSGKTRFIGFTGHKSPHILAKMLEADFEWDSCQMPVNVMDGLFRSFEREILPELNRRGIACLGMKSVGGDGQFIEKAGLTAEQCRRYSLSQPIATLICGIQSEDDLRQDLAIARSFEPMTAGEMEDLRSTVRREATDGRHEWFKTTTFFDHEFHRNQHGFPPHAETRRVGVPEAE